MLGPFRIERLLGKGGMATVYEAYEGGVLERVIALKVLPPEFLHDGTFASRFTQEARFAAALEHSNIVPIYASGINDRIPWMSMRLITAGTVADLLAQNSNGVGGEQIWKILDGVAEALDYAHARGVIHRDIKPSNILLDKDGRAYISDFGLALLMEGGERFTQTRVALGTPRYMAPEQALGLAVDARCDVYSLGVVAYEMLTGTTPFRGSALGILKQHLEDPVPVPARTVVSEERFDVLKKALAKKPGDRWQSAGQFIAELRSAANETSMTGVRRQYSVVARWAVGNDGIVRWTVSALERCVPAAGAIASRATHAAGRGATYRARAATDPTCGKRHAPDTITLDSSLVTPAHYPIEFADQHPIDDAGQLTLATLTCVLVCPTATNNDA
jgi:serine/threonine protein kinase